MDNDRQWEQRLLGEILVDDPSLQRPAFRSLAPGDFRDPRNMLIFFAAKKVAEQGCSRSLTAIVEWLHERELLEWAGGEEYVCEVITPAIRRGWESMWRKGTN